ncbi:MAG: glycosyltransferase family 10 [Verrucomicrobiota bacterium]|jgi:glycosyltransferase involved in cell wall biosynthesis
MPNPIRIDFCDFGPGFVKTNNFFYNLLQSRFPVELCDQPDYLIYADPLRHLHRVHNCVRIYFGIESYLPDWTECDYALTCHYLDDPRHLRLPYYALYGGPEALDIRQDNPEKVLASKTRFCAFVVGYADRQTRKRVDFFHRLSRYKRVDSAGKALNNVGGPLSPGPGSKVEFLRSCKFNIAFENASIPGYTTEKIYEAMMARSLPIYWGNPRIAEEFNPKSFLNYFDFPSEEALIQRIIELDQDDAKYLEVMRQPYFHNHQPNEFLSRERLLDFFEKIFTTNICPVSRRRPFFRLGRWIGLKRNKPHGL